jgi:hypothetical protein
MSQSAYFPTQTATGGDVDFTALPTVIGATGSAASMFGLLFWMLATDRMITGAGHRREIAVKNEQIATQRETIAVKDRQLERLAVVGETVVKILDSVETQARRAR